MPVEQLEQLAARLKEASDRMVEMEEQLAAQVGDRQRLEAELEQRATESRAEVARLEVTRADVFGSGIKGPARHRRYTVTMGGPALRLHLHDGRSVTLGTPDPQRLASFVQARLPASRR